MFRKTYSTLYDLTDMFRILKRRTIKLDLIILNVSGYSHKQLREWFVSNQGNGF
jgi:hypothetical protein